MSADDLVSRLKLTNPGALTGKLREALAATALPSPRHVLDTALADASFRIIDIEATGLSTSEDELIEVAVYELRAGKTTLLLDTLVRKCTGVARCLRADSRCALWRCLGRAQCIERCGLHWQRRLALRSALEHSTVRLHTQALARASTR